MLHYVHQVVAKFVRFGGQGAYSVQLFGCLLWLETMLMRAVRVNQNGDLKTGIKKPSVELRVTIEILFVSKSKVTFLVTYSH